MALPENLIAAERFAFRGRIYEPGDRFDPSRLSVLERRNAERMTGPGVRKLVEFSEEAMVAALRFRSAEAGVPRGFTAPGLVALGLIDNDEAAARGWIEQTEGDYVPPAGSERVGTLWVIPVRTSGPPRYDIVETDGQRAITTGTISGKQRAMDAAQKLMDERPSAEPPSPETEPEGQGTGLDNEEAARIAAEAAAHMALAAAAGADLSAMSTEQLRGYLIEHGAAAADDATPDQVATAATELQDRARTALNHEGGDGGGDVQSKPDGTA